MTLTSYFFLVRFHLHIYLHPHSSGWGEDGERTVRGDQSAPANDHLYRWSRLVAEYQVPGPNLHTNHHVAQGELGAGLSAEDEDGGLDGVHAASGWSLDWGN